MYAYVHMHLCMCALTCKGKTLSAAEEPCNHAAIERPSTLQTTVFINFNCIIVGFAMYVCLFRKQLG